MPLTVAEKTHWRDRIAARIERKVEALTAGDPGLFDRIKDEARIRALHSLGLAELQAELDLLAGDRKALDRRENLTRMRIVARLKGIPIEEVPSNAAIDYPFKQTLNVAVQKRQAVHEQELLADQELGRAVLRLRAEKENLLDVVWLAASPGQIKQLWTKVAELLGEEPTPLEREALAIEPPGAG
ncbi:hypothetical protein BH23PLA1_BH23PLA1_42610 [soil metagenome]